MQRFFVPELDKDASLIELPEEEAKHACRVLRMKEGDKLQLINGKGLLVEAEIESNNPKKCLAKCLNYFEDSPPVNRLHIAISPTKNMDRMEWFVEKATEIGVDCITPVVTANSERRVLKTDRLHKIILSATKQSKRLFLPVLSEAVAFEQFIQQHPKGLIAHCGEGEVKTELHTIDFQIDTVILIGPEGDFNPIEIALALKNEYLAVTLGANRLRTETAGIYAAAIIKAKMA